MFYYCGALEVPQEKSMKKQSPDMKKTQICVSVNRETLEYIDATRGEMSRASFISDALYWGFVADEIMLERYDVALGK